MTPDPAVTYATDFVLRLPDDANVAADQDQEWCEVLQEGRIRKIRFHDYDAIYSIPGLYERLIYEELQCESPRVIARLLADELDKRGTDPAELRVLDLGAGNGIVGEELAAIGAGHLVGVDIIESAAEAAERDRPDVYDDYVVADITDGDGPAASLDDHRLNAMTCVAALGFGDIPPEAFCEALRKLDTPALVAYTIKETFLTDGDSSGFSKLVKRLEEEGSLVPLAQERYRHRFSWAGKPIHYVAFVAEKRAEV